MRPTALGDLHDVVLDFRSLSLFSISTDIRQSDLPEAVDGLRHIDR